jgi:hypothetical protein
MRPTFKEVEVMAEQQGLIILLRRARVGFFAIVAAVLTFGRLTEVLGNGKAHDRTSHLGPGWEAERDFGHGWGLDASVGFYEGPLLGSQGQRVLSLF